ncbi:MAG: hypothetical protein J7K00_00835 [Candidatus Diapherotrites archaeon]|nr:hypothetical protein [Candidatus Diapherotrites archaeon]
MEKREVALGLTKIYFEELLRSGVRRQMELDDLINAYVYTLSRLEKTDKEMEIMQPAIKKEETELEKDVKEGVPVFPEFPSFDEDITKA